MNISKLLTSTACTAAVSLALFSAGTANAEKYLIIANGNTLPAEIYTQVGAAGGFLEKNYDFGVGVADSSDPAFAEKLLNMANVKDVVLDAGFDATSPVNNEFGADFANPPSSGDDDRFFDLQWGHNYVGAVESWNAGHRGAGVRVAVLDGGFDTDHPDLAPNVNLALSQDFTGEGLVYALPDTFSHGTHTAGTIGAADNGFGTIGVAPEVELVLVKVLGDGGSGSFADVIAGIYHAANVDADVISMSLGAYIVRQGQGGENAGISALQNAVNKAITYAHQQGSTVIVSAGNDAQDLNGDKGAVRFQTGMSHAVGISAVATQNWAGGATELYPATYTNYGTSMVDFAAPGGDVAYPGNENCTVAGITRPCWVFDLVFSTGNNGWYWSGGTSMAAPHAAGVAALIISETGDSSPAHVMREMRRRGIDGGKKGRDGVYGHGLANTGN